MKVDLGDLNAFVAVARARGFRDGARASGASASGLSEAVRRLEAQLGVRLLNRTTRSVAPTEAGERLLERLGPALTEVEAALDVVNGFRDRPAGTLRLNVPVSAARLVLPRIVPPFLAAYPEITAGGDRRGQLRRRAGGRLRRRHPLRRAAGAGHDRGADRAARPALRRRRRARLSRSPRPARSIRATCSATPACAAASPAARCRRGSSSATARWCGSIRRGRCSCSSAAATDLAVDAAIAGTGIIYLFEDWLRPHLDSGALEPVLEPWWQRFSGPFLYYPGRRLVPAPLRAFVDFVKAWRDAA